MNKKVEEVETVEDATTVDTIVTKDEKELKTILKGSNPVMSLIKHYLFLETGEVKRGFYMGKTMYIDDQQEEHKAVMIMDENKKVFVAPQTVLVNALGSLDMHTPIEITNLGKPNGKKYISYSVVLLG